MKKVEIAVENEFLRWDNETAKKFVIDGLGWMRTDNNIPAHDAWSDTCKFENIAIETLKSLVQDNYDLDITDILLKAEHLFLTAKQNKNTQLIQVYERIIYELTECSIREFSELKRAISNGDKKL